MESLRDRIAAVIIDAIGGEYDHLRHSEALAAADAVIAEMAEYFLSTRTSIWQSNE